MQVLLTGGAGYIGSHTAVELMQLGHEVILLDNFANSSPVVVDRIALITGRAPRLAAVDLTDQQAVTRVMEDIEFDAVIHFAGLKAVGESLEKPLEYYRNNIDSTIILLELMRERSVQNLVFSSSATVYGAPTSARISESHRVGIGITNPYGATKMMNERLISDFARTVEGFTAVLLRYFNPVGAHSSGLIGEDPAGMPNNLMPYISQVAIGRREVLPVYGDSYPTRDGSGERDFIHVVDLALGHIAALELSRNGTYAVNLGTGIGTTVLEAIDTFEKVTGAAVPYKIVDRREGDVGSVIADPTLAASLLNWRASRTFEDACRDSWNWQSANPKGYEQ